MIILTLLILCAHRELMEVFPNAKVILTSRDPERWYKSVKNSIMVIRHSYSFLHVQLFLQMTGGQRVTNMVSESSNIPKGCLQKGNVNVFQCTSYFLIKYNILIPTS